MCGIVACHRRQNALDFLLPGLSRLEYRGYDSSGVALAAPGGLVRRRVVGRLDQLTRAAHDLNGSGHAGLGIGHTRWATHGAVTQANAHPHTDCSGAVAVVHNGIIENAAELRTRLERAGHTFASDVDSEVVAHLVEEARSGGGSLREAVRYASEELRGSWALGVLAPDALAVAAHRSPLLVASGPGGHFVASDATAVLGWADAVQVLRDGDVVEMGSAVRWFDRWGREGGGPAAIPIDWSAEDADTAGFDDFMDKEIAEQPAITARLIDELLPGLDGSLWAGHGLPRMERLRFVACGTSLHAAAVAARVARTVAAVPAEVVVASEADDGHVEEGAVTVAISQSGETADVLSALDGVTGPVVAVTNVGHSTLARRADATVGCRAGPEVGVAATKTFTAQVVAGVGLVTAGGRDAGLVDAVTERRLAQRLACLPDRLEAGYHVARTAADAIAPDVADAPGFLFVSRGAGLPYAAEGALKLKELSYRWAESHAAGELKHGPLALVEEGLPVVAVDGGSLSKLDANLEEMRARGARVIRIGAAPDAVFPLSPDCAADPWGPLEAVLPLQHFARALALALGRDVDRPRNLAKSVTVE